MKGKQKRLLWRIPLSDGLLVLAWLLPLEGPWKGLAFLLHLLQEGICLVFEGVAGRSDLDAVGSCQQIVDGAASAASATDQSDFQLTAVRCLVGQVRNIVLTGLFERNKFCVPAFAAARRQDGCRSNYGRSSDSCTAAEKFSS